MFEYVVAAQAMCFRLHFDGDMAQSVVFYAVALGVELWLLTSNTSGGLGP